MNILDYTPVTWQTIGSVAVIMAVLVLVAAWLKIGFRDRP